MEFMNVFTKGSKLVKVTSYKAIIKTDGKLPLPQHVHPTGLVKKQVIEDIINQLLAWDIVEKSVSTMASPIMMVWQNNKWCFCVDFRKLNEVTLEDAYPILRSDYVFSTLAGKCFFTLIDTIKGYHQVELEENDKHKTALISYKGLFQFKCLPFGLKNAPVQF